VRIGWLSTGRDQAASTLLAEVVGRASRDEIALDIACVFCDRPRGESPESDHFLDLAARFHIPAVTASSAASWTTAQAEGITRARWREDFHAEVIRLLEPFGLDVLVMAGYMLIVSPAMCRRYALLNLHPALPGGPTGTWQDVIWQLLDEESGETGAMVHLATPELDSGPVVALCRFSLKGPEWEPLWARLREKRRTLSVAEIAAAEGESEPLFAEIRRRGEVREIPLLYQTVRRFADGKLSTADGGVFSESARLPLDLTEPVEQELAAEKVT
jgi:phosphoribosylglycinamide formyltransferase-1